MSFNSIAGIIIISLIVFPGIDPCFCSSMQESDSLLDFRQLLQEFTEFSPNPCELDGQKKDFPSGQIESRLFSLASEMIIKELNAGSDVPKSPQERAEETLKKLEQLSATVNGAWPDENRFHFQVLDLPPALVVKVSIRTHETFVVFGVPEKDCGKPNSLWKMVGSDTDYFVDEPLFSGLNIYRLNRGPSGHTRFLAVFERGGCAGCTGVVYDAHEWDPEDNGTLKQVIHQTGAFGMDDKVPGFAQIGQLQTNGSMITLPYCRFSDIDTWDNPSLCAVDTYDISGDSVRFHSRKYNRPDLVPIAKVIEYSKQRDYPAVLGYCASSEVARKLVSNVLPYLFPDEVRVSRRGKEKEHVELGSGPTYSFDVQKFAGHWRVVAFSIK